MCRNKKTVRYVELAMKNHMEIIWVVNIKNEQRVSKYVGIKEQWCGGAGILAGGKITKLPEFGIVGIKKIHSASKYDKK